MKRLNLGCGRDYRNDWDNWDISSAVKADKYLDISSGKWPALNDHYDEVYCSGVLEQLLSNKHLLHVMNETWRILQHGGKFSIIVPDAKFSNAFRDPFDVRQFTQSTFKYFDQDEREYHLYGSVYGFKPWKIQNIMTNERGIMQIVLRKP